MPFSEDINADEETLRHPIWSVFALVKDNLERMIAVNIGWAIQLIPALIAISFTGLPMVLRVLLILYSSTALIPATGLLFACAARVCQYEAVNLEILKEDACNLFLPSLLHLGPLFGLLGFWYGMIVLVAMAHIWLLDLMLRLVMLILLVCSLYWGPLFVKYPDHTSLSLFLRSLRLVWRYPGPTLLTGSVVILMSVLGVISIGGLFLIVPIIVALLQSRRCHELLTRGWTSRHRSMEKTKEVSPPMTGERAV